MMSFCHDEKLDFYIFIGYNLNIHRTFQFSFARFPERAFFLSLIIFLKKQTLHFIIFYPALPYPTLPNWHTVKMSYVKSADVN
jgi:hypothetical protein